MPCLIHSLPSWDVMVKLCRVPARSAHLYKWAGLTDLEKWPKGWSETLSSPLLSLPREGKNQENAWLVDLCQHCTEDFKLPPSHLLASRNFCGAAELAWPGTVHWADAVLTLCFVCNVYLVLESRLHSSHAQAGSTMYNHDCVMLCLR